MALVSILPSISGSTIFIAKSDVLAPRAEASQLSLLDVESAACKIIDCASSSTQPVSFLDEKAVVLIIISGL